jgi:hypothetical protein
MGPPRIPRKTLSLSVNAELFADLRRSAALACLPLSTFAAEVLESDAATRRLPNVPPTVKTSFGIDSTRRKKTARTEV